MNPETLLLEEYKVLSNAVSKYQTFYSALIPLLLTVAAFCVEKVASSQPYGYVVVLWSLMLLVVWGGITHSHLCCLSVHLASLEFRLNDIAGLQTRVPERRNARFNFLGRYGLSINAYLLGDGFETIRGFARQNRVLASAALIGMVLLAVAGLTKPAPGNPTWWLRARIPICVAPIALSFYSVVEQRRVGGWTQSRIREIAEQSPSGEARRALPQASPS